MAEEKKYPYSGGSYIPDDHPDVVKRKEKREKAKKILNKITDLIPFKTKKFKKAIKEEKEEFESKTDKQKIDVAKATEDSFINAKARRATKTEGSFAKGGRAGYKGGKSVKKKGGCAIKGKSPILR
mgnify:FL=1